MPKLGMELIRKAALVDATITEIGRAGSLDVTVSQIARRAGMSSALAHHYFGSKEQIFLAAMRHILTLYGAEVRGALATAESDRDRVVGIIRASFTHTNFRREVIGAWLNFYVLAQTQADAARLLAVYQRRLRSNFVHNLRPLVGDRSVALADGLGAMIDGVYIREALSPRAPDGARAAKAVLDYLARDLESAADCAEASAPADGGGGI
jgi:TetR/AcrR family transcriptional repressor of bet genes